MQRICVYCGSSSGKKDDFSRAAQQLGKLLARQGIGLVYGAGNVGLMGEIADACLNAGGEVTGVIPQALVEKEVCHESLTELHVVDSMHQRKALMAELSDGFIALPGGLGTLEELIEVLTWTQLGFHRKPAGLLNVSGYYDHLMKFLDNAVDQRFLKPEHRDMLVVTDNPTVILNKLLTSKTAYTDKWIKRHE